MSTTIVFEEDLSVGRFHKLDGDSVTVNSVMFSDAIKKLEECQEENSELKKKLKANKEAVMKHFKHYCTLKHYPNWNNVDVDLWKHFKMEGEG